MKVKSVLIIISCLVALAFVSCDDSLNAVGGSIQPPADTISVTTDTLVVQARTISMQDSVYARTINGVLGQYEDNLFGTIKSDYLCQFFYPEKAKFQDNLLAIDSAQFIIGFNSYSGDTLAPMGLSVYEATKLIPQNFYTNTNPQMYIGDKPTLLASEAYTISGTKIVAVNSGVKLREIVADLGVDFGKRIYNGWKNNVFKDQETLNKFFKGTYVTTNFGSSSLIRVSYSSIAIHYKYNDVKGNHDKTKDTIRTSTFSLAVTDEVMQLNSIKNKNPKELFVEGTGATYLKTPAGVYTEVTLPIKQIKANMDAKKFKTINTALFNLKGYTERESTASYELGRPTYLLLINKDSIDSFFSSRQLSYGISNILSGRRTSNNVYSFSNISRLINTYMNMNLDKDPVFAVIPVDRRYVVESDSQGNQSEKVVGITNYLQPSTSIIRSDPQNMRLELVYSKF